MCEMKTDQYVSELYSGLLYVACWTEFLILKMEAIRFPKSLQACAILQCVIPKNAVLFKLFDI